MRANPYESKRYLDEYLLLHYGKPLEVCPFPFVPRDWLRFQSRICEECLLPVHRTGSTRALDLGCAVGRFTFELGQVVDDVLGIDNSRGFIRAARQMAKLKARMVSVRESGARSIRRQVALPKALRGGAVDFKVGDALDLSEFADHSYHVVSAINLLDRLPRPRCLLDQLPRLLAPGGQLILASPFTWLEEFTPKREWLTVEQVQELLAPMFRLARRQDVPFVIREHRRKYQLGISDVLTFVRRRE